MKNLDDALVKRAKAGDRQAIETLLEEVAPLVHRFGLRMCRHAADAEDVLQDTLLSIANHVSEFEGRSSLASWVFTLARTACARRRRGLKNQPHLPDDALWASATDEPTPEHAAEQLRLRRALESALSSLSDEQREVLLLRDMEGLTAPEVAATLGLSVDAVKSRLHRARSALREVLRTTFDDSDVKQPSAECPDVLLAFSQKLEGDLGADDCAAMEKHIASCAACGATCSTLRAALWACKNETTHTVSPRVQMIIKTALAHLVEQC